MRRALGRLWPYVRDARRAVGLGLACILVASVVSLASPWVLKYAIDDLMAGVSRDRLAAYGLAILGLALVDGLFRYLMRTYLIGASRAIEYALRNDFFAHLERLPLGYFQSTRTGDLMSRATNDLNAVRMMIGPAVMYAATTGLTFVVATAVMISIDPWLTLYSLVPLPFVSISVAVFGDRKSTRLNSSHTDISRMPSSA